VSPAKPLPRLAASAATELRKNTFGARVRRIIVIRQSCRPGARCVCEQCHLEGEARILNLEKAGGIFVQADLEQ